jgi:hypothetical protein
MHNLIALASLARYAIQRQAKAELSSINVHTTLIF